MKYIDAELLRKDIDNWKEAMADAVGEYSDGVRFALEHFTFVLDSFQQEQPETPVIEVTARCVYESWMGGTMNDVRRHMNELGRVLNARKEE